MQKPLQVTYKGLDRSPALDALIEKRVESLERLFDRIIGCRVVVEIPHRSAHSAKTPIAVAVELEIPDHPVIVGKDAQDRREAKEDHTAALNNAFDAVERQLKKVTEARGDQHVLRHEASGESGMVVSLFPEQSYGFVEVDGSPQLYFTRTAVVGGSYDELAPGMLVHVTRATTEGPMGPQASSVRLLGRSTTPE